jgi:hypothetical protein
MCECEGEHLIPDKWPDKNTFVDDAHPNPQRQSVIFLAAQKFEVCL